MYSANKQLTTAALEHIERVAKDYPYSTATEFLRRLIEYAPNDLVRVVERLASEASEIEE